MSITSVCLSVTLVDCDHNKQWKSAHDRIGRCLLIGDMNTEADPDLSILLSRVLYSSMGYRYGKCGALHFAGNNLRKVRATARTSRHFKFSTSAELLELTIVYRYGVING